MTVVGYCQTQQTDDSLFLKRLLDKKCLKVAIQSNT